MKAYRPRSLLRLSLQQLVRCQGVVEGYRWARTLCAADRDWCCRYLAHRAKHLHHDAPRWERARARVAALIPAACLEESHGHTFTNQQMAEAHYVGKARKETA